MRALALVVLVAACARGGDDGAEPGAASTSAAGGGAGGAWFLPPRAHGGVPVVLPSDGGGGSGGSTTETLSEAQACAWVLSAIQQRTLELGCSSTVQGCPAMLALHSGRSCLLYDLGRTGICVEAIGEANVCGDVLELPCEHDLHVPGSAPEGC